MDEALRSKIRNIRKERLIPKPLSLYEEKQRQAFVENLVRKAFEKHVLEPNGQTWADLDLDAEKAQPA